MDTVEKISALMIEFDKKKEQMSERELLEHIEEIKRMQTYLDITKNKKKNNK